MNPYLNPLIPINNNKNNDNEPTVMVAFDLNKAKDM